ncbi:O-antigen translocase [Coprobacter sp.]
MSEKESVSTYRRIVKATGLFGGAQVVGILCSVVKAKLIAIWLGAEGVGIIGLYNTALEMITSVTGLGLRQSTVRDVSKVASEKDGRKLSEIILVVRRWSWFVGLFGAVTVLSFSSLLSRWTFGNEQYIWGFVWLSCALLFNALSSGEQALLQGLGRMKVLAKSSVWGAVVALLLSLPMYYFWRIEGIVPSLILTALTSLFFTWIYSRRTPVQKTELSVSETWRKGKPMARLGIYMTVSSFITTLLNYFFIAWLNSRSGTADVGYYTAGFTLVTRYVGLVFTAMGTEYYPRLAAVGDNRKLVGIQVSRQAEASLLILLPIICVFLVCQSWIIRILYTVDFLQIEGYTSWAILGVLFKAVSWTMGFVLLAKGAGRIFLFTEFLSDTTSFALNIIAYMFWGLEGIGVAYLINFFLYGIGMWLLCRIYYRLCFEKSLYKVLGTVLSLCIPVFLLCRYGISKNTVLLAVILTLVSIGYSVLQLKKKLDY